MKIRRIYALFFALLPVLAPRGADATTVTDLLVATVPVADQSDAERERGFRAGLGQVVVKLTGQRAVLGDAGVPELVATAPQLVERYNYVQAPGSGSQSESESESESEPEVADKPNFLLQVKFAAAPVDAALRRLHVPLWPAQRPQLLLLASGDEGDRTAVIEVARRVLAERGVPLLEPLWDLQDLQDLQAIGATHAAFAADRIEAVAHRYGASLWLALDPAVGGDSQGGRWRLGGSGALLAGASTADSLAHWVEASVGDAVDQLAARLAYLPRTGSAPQTLVIEDVRSYGAYRAVLDTLKAMEFVRRVEVTEMAAGRLNLALHLDSDPNLLWAALDSNPRFDAIAPAVAAAPEVQPPAESAAQSSVDAAAGSTAETTPTPEATPQTAVIPPAEPAAKPAAERHYLWREP